MTARRVVMAESSDILHDYRVQKEATSLAAAGYAVHVLGFRTTRRRPADAAFPFALTTLPVASRRRRWLRNLSMILIIALLNVRLVLTRADVYHAHNTMFLWGMHLGARLHGGRFIYDAHEVQWEKGRVMATLEKLYIRRADAVINVAPGRAREVARRHGIPRERITVIANYPIYDAHLAARSVSAPVAPPENAPANTRPATPAAALRLIFSGGFELATNRLDNLVRAMVRVPGVDLYLMAFGYRDGEAVMRRLRAEHDLGSRVHFLPLVKPHEVMGAISGYDVAVNLLTNPRNHLSIRHPSVNKMYEYLAAGLPILCSDLPGFRTEFVDEGAAIAVDATSVAAVAAGLCELLARREELPRLRQRALALARDRYNWQTQEAALLALYGSLLR
jgi:glycosyltransferase involved in cell wall biosynthesis